MVGLSYLASLSRVIKDDGCRTSLLFVVDSFLGVCRTLTLVGALLSELGHCSLPWCHTPSMIALRLHTSKASLIWHARDISSICVYRRSGLHLFDKLCRAYVE